MVARPGLLLAIVLLASACGSSDPSLHVALAGPAQATPLVFHGSCFTGYLLELDLVVTAGSNSDVMVGGIDYAVRDVTTGAEIGRDTLAAPTLVDRYGGDALLIPAAGARSYRIGVLSQRGPHSGPVEIAGRVSGRDMDGHAAVASYSLRSADVEGITYVRDPNGFCGG
jgi:hypothetical protein